MKDQPNKAKIFLEHVRVTLDSSVENLDASVRSRLVRARYAALESRRTIGMTTWKRLSFSVGSLAVAATIWMAITTFQTHRMNELVAGVTIEDLELVTSSDSLDFFTNLDFYLWLAEEGNTVISEGPLHSTDSRCHEQYIAIRHACKEPVFNSI